MKRGIGIRGRTHSLAMGCVLLALSALAPRAAQAFIHCVGAGWTGGACTFRYIDLQLALSMYFPGDEIWVAKGTYKPTCDTHREATFQLKNYVAIYGGFTGSETTRSARNWAANPTILSGDIGNTGDKTDNSYHVVTGSGTNNTAILDGFVITGGNADGAQSPHNHGGGIYNNGGSPRLANVTFSGNHARYGGGMSNYSGSPRLSNVIFKENSAATGGGMVNMYSSPTVSNATFTGNSSAYEGGGMVNMSSNPTVFNCILWGDTGGEIFDYDSSPKVTYSLVQGGYDGGDHIIDQDPLFIDAVGGELCLWSGSPAIDAGNIFLVAQDFSDMDGDGNTTEPAPYDMWGRPRGSGFSVDMGAYEHTPHWYAILCVGAGWTGNSTCNFIYAGLQAALSESNMGTEIRVVKGKYKPTSGTDRKATFQLKSGVALYGGFTGSETARSARNWAANATILSGDLNGDDSGFDNNGENSYHVVTGSATDKTAILDGFVITEGKAEGQEYYGGGMFSSGGSPALSNITFSGSFAGIGGGMSTSSGSPRLSNVIFRGNKADDGGGMFNSGGSPALSNVTFSGNFAGIGGGMHNDLGSPMLSNVTFSGNEATTLFGGGMVNTGGSPMLSNVTFSGNRGVIGGGMANTWTSPRLSNVTFSGNFAESNGGGMHNAGNVSATLSNCILWGDSGGEIYTAEDSSSTVTYSLVQGGYDGEGNLDGEESPFMDAANGDLYLPAGSPAIDKGSNSLVARDFTDLDRDGNASEPVPYDLAGGPRIVNGAVDMGAYEYQGAATSVELAYFRAVRFNGAILVKWKTASETDNAGFHVWRSGKKDGKYERLTESPIPAQGSPFEGAAYSFEDTEVGPGKAYFYKLEDIDINGASTFHGPVKAQDRR